MDEPYDERPENSDEGYVEERNVHQPVAALVPEHVGSGVLATTVIVSQNTSETVIDFVARVARPYRVVARVVLSRNVFLRLVAALEENLAVFEQHHGDLTATTATGSRPGLPSEDSTPQSASGSGGTGPAPTIADVYDELKLPESLHSGVYANAVTIGHTHAEFWLDFITNFYPKAAVSCRVYVAAGQITRILKTFLRHVG